MFVRGGLKVTSEFSEKKTVCLFKTSISLTADMDRRARMMKIEVAIPH